MLNKRVENNLAQEEACPQIAQTSSDKDSSS